MSTELDLGWFDPALGSLARRDTAGFGSGLSRAIAARLGIDLVIVRIAFVALGLCAGVGLALYLWGTVLTRGPQGVRPIDSIVPQFSAWSTSTQKWIVALSTIAIISLASAISPSSWGTGLIALIALLLLRRKPADSRSPLPEDTLLVDAGNSESQIAQWRTRMAKAAGTSQWKPTSPVEAAVTHLPSGPLAPRPKPSWLAGLVVLGAALGAGSTAAFLFDLGVPQSLAIGTIVGGALAIGYSLIEREKRLPRAILSVLVLALAATGWVSTQLAQPNGEQPGEHEFVVIADSKVIDLSDQEFQPGEIVRIEAVLSDVEVVLPAAPAEQNVTSRLSEVDLAGTEGLQAGHYRLELVSSLSEVTMRGAK